MVRVHSEVDLITNSSTTIYSSATKNTVKQVSDFVNAVLKSAGSKARCGDLFTLELIPDDNMVEQEWDNMRWEAKEDPSAEIHKFLSPAEMDVIFNGDYASGTALVKKAIRAGYSLQFANGDNSTNSIRVVEVATGNEVDISSLLNSIDTWENYE